MAEPTVKNGEKHFVGTLYEGNGTAIGSGGKTISGLQFQPDLVWIKNRDASASHGLYDSSRGATKQLESDQTSAETTESEGLTSFTSDGFTLGNLAQVNTNNQSFVSWNWKAGGTAPSKTYTVKVVSDGGNKYRFDDFGTSAVTLDLQEGGTYTFDLSDSSNDGHPMKFSEVSNGSHGGGSTYSTGVVYQLDNTSVTESNYYNTSNFNSASSRKIIITLVASAPTLYYFCHYHSGMGGQVNTNSTFGSSNFDGSIQSTVQTNLDAGFSIVRYNGTGSAGTIGHGLSSPPSWVMAKSRSNNTGDSFSVYHTGMTSASYYLRLGGNNAQSNASTVWDGKAPTSSVFSVGTATGTNTNTYTYVAYCWHGVDGFSKFSSYEGLATDNFVYTGFAPQFLMIKKYTGGTFNTGDSDWMIFDNKTDINKTPYRQYNRANLSNAESYTNKVHLYSNGFMVTGVGNSLNATNGSYLYFCFASHPFIGDGTNPVTAK